MSSLAPILITTKPFEIILNDQNHTDRIADFLVNFFCKDVVNIIITYYVNKLYWKYKQNYKKFKQCNYKIIDYNIIYFSLTNSSEVRSLKTNEIIMTTDKSMSILDVFIDSPYIYAILQNTVLSVHYYNKNKNNLNLHFEPSAYFVYNYIRFIKNKIFYTINLYEHTKEIIMENKEYKIKNINISENKLRKTNGHSDRKCTIEHIFVHTDNKIAVTIATPFATSLSDRHNIYNVNLENNVNLLCIEVDKYRSVILYYDGEHAIYAHQYRDKDIIFCYSKFDNKVYKCAVGGNVICALADIILLEKHDRMFVYQS